MVPAVAQSADVRVTVFIYSCPRALCQHLEWAVARILGRPVAIDWTTQPILPTTLRTEIEFAAVAGSAAALVSELRAFPNVRLEVVEDPGPDRCGQRFAVSPALGVFRATTAANGDVLLGEEQVRAAMASEDPRQSLDIALGGPWDEELEPFRMAADSVGVRWLTQVG